MIKKISTAVCYTLILIFIAVIATNMALVYATIENNTAARHAEEHTYEMRTKITAVSSDGVVMLEPETRVSLSHIVVTEPITVSAAQ